ncbi:MAG: glycosyltransferase family A protein [Nostoc sp. ChiSLP02]|nr:glycosyltransferase family A protein [Nostoc sp. DedSLP05]MDZ8099607.1 glycosyltransferase family A protein [Nostoc sp. DedSLP01]MDZ8188160.1 glycosyltransferase family A protein [Nostoc sp. ChiSLP02]
MANNPLVSVIIPVYNCNQYLAQAIESVLSQTYQPIEIIVVDDGSTDNSAEVAKHYAPLIRYCFQSNAGSGAARNRGIELAQGEFFAFLDADDLWVKDKLMHQMAAFNNNSELHIVFGQVKQFHSPELDEAFKAKIHCPAELMPGTIPSALLMKREAFFHVGRFEVNWQVVEFASWYMRANELNMNMLILPELVTLRRLHTTNKGVSQQRQEITEYAHILKASLDRRRIASERKVEV